VIHATVLTIADLLFESPDIVASLQTAEIVRNLLVIGRSAHTRGPVLSAVYRWATAIATGEGEMVARWPNPGGD
jgi:hypothetical protein